MKFKFMGKWRFMKWFSRLDPDVVENCAGIKMIQVRGVTTS